MKCPRCQHATQADSVFCDECGAVFEAACPACSEANRVGAKFCRKCGQRLSTQKAPSPDSYTPKYLAERILTSKGALEGERKHVTILFADLKGSMELLANRDPEDARKILDPVLERMIEAVHRFEGTVNQVMGDGIMALFGAPLAHEDHAVRACYAALRMQETVKQYAETVRREPGVAIRIRVGLNSGEVVVRAIGSDLHMDYTAVGQTTHLAARMEQLAEPGTTLLTPATLALSGDFVQVKSLGPTQVKGLSETVDAYELTGANAVGSRFHARAARGLTKFVGRATEMSQLADADDLAQSGRGQVVAVVGEPGIGKSRLFWEFANSHRTGGGLVIEATSLSYGRATPYLPIIELLKVYFGIEPRDDAGTIREKVSGKLNSLDRVMEAEPSPLLALFDVPVVDVEWTRLAPPQRRQRTLDAVKRVLLSETRVQPVIVIVEDLHWIDGETQALLDGLVESLPAARLLLLVNYRPEYQHAWSGKTYYRQLRVDPLPAGSVDDLLTALLGTDPTLDALKGLLLRRTEGNPFFLEESVRALIEANVLVPDSDGFRLTKAPERIEIPATAQAMIAARIDRLDPEDKRVLQTASVVGTEIPFAILEAIAQTDDDALRRSIARLQTAEFLYEAALFPDLEYMFKHAVTHDVAYNGLLLDRRRALHADTVAAIERLYDGRLSEHVHVLADHALRGELWPQAVSYLRQAGAKDAGRSSNRDAASRFEQALTALSRCPEDADTAERAIDIRFELHAVLVVLGELDRMLDVLSEIEALAEAQNDRRRLGRVRAHMSYVFSSRGDSKRGIEAGQSALMIADELNDPTLEVLASIRFAQAHFFFGQFRRGIEFFKRALRAAKRVPITGLPDDPAILCLVQIALCYCYLGDFAAAKAAIQEAVSAAESAGHAYGLVHSYGALGFFHSTLGNFPEAVFWAEKGFDRARDIDIPIMFVLTGGRLGVAYARSGRLNEALPLLEQVVEQCAAMKFNLPSGLGAITWLSEAYLLAGRTNDAARTVLRALDLARSHTRVFEAESLKVLGDIHASAEPADVAGAEHRYEAALAIAEQFGMRPVAAHCHAGLARLYEHTGALKQAQEHATTAAAMYREMGMTDYLEKIEREFLRE